MDNRSQTKHKNKPSMTFMLILLPLTITLSGCDFFGKKTHEPKEGVIGSLQNGQNIVGSWTINYASTSTTNNNPAYAYTETLTFEPSYAAKIELKDQHQNGITCTAFGEFRVYGNDVHFYTQAISSPMCGFDALYKFNSVTVNKGVLSYINPDDGKNYTYFNLFPPQYNTLTGLWDFQNAAANPDGDGGYEWILFDPNGYFIVQTKYEGAHYLIYGYYSIDNTGKVTMTYFDGDPNHTTGSEIFTKHSSSGTTLSLTYTDQSNVDVTYTGTRL